MRVTDAGTSKLRSAVRVAVTTIESTATGVDSGDCATAGPACAAATARAHCDATSAELTAALGIREGIGAFGGDKGAIGARAPRYFGGRASIAMDANQAARSAISTSVSGLAMTLMISLVRAPPR